MRIVLHGQQAFPSCAGKIAERRRCCRCMLRSNKRRSARSLLATYAREKGLPVYQPASWKTPEALALMVSFKADVCMMAYVLLFVPEVVLNAPKYGTFQYHPSCACASWLSSINCRSHGEVTTVSIFWPATLMKARSCCKNHKDGLMKLCDDFKSCR